MKLKYYSEQTFPKQFGRGPTTPRVSLSRSGIIKLNASACDLIGLREGDKITIAQDEEDKNNWYVFKDENHGFTLRQGYDSKKEGGSLMTNHKKLQQHMCFDLGLDPVETTSFLIAGIPTMMKGDKTEYFGLLQTAKV